MNVNKFWFLALLLSAALVLAACPASPATPTAAQPTAAPVAAATAAPVAATAAPMDDSMAAMDWENVDPSGQTVNFWHQHTRARETSLQEIIQEFNETNEYGITVVAEYQGSYQDIFNKMLNVLNTRDVPELVVAYQNQAATYQLADGLVDIRSLIDSPKWGLSDAEKADFFAGFYASDLFPSFDNQRLGFPPNRSMEMLFYNATWLQELGYDGPPTTPEEFREMACKAVEQPFSKATGGTSVGYELDINTSRFASWTFGFGGDIFDYETGHFTLNSDAAVAAMTFMTELFEAGCARQVAEEYGDQTDFGNGVTLFTVGSSSGLPFYQGAVEAGAGNFEWSVAAVPHVTPDPVMNIYGASVSIPKSTPEQELASWLFVKYYTSPPVQAKWALASNYFPVRESVANEMADYIASNPAYKTAFELLPYGHTEPPVPGYDFVRVRIEEVMAAIVDGADIQSSLDALNTEANAILAEQMADIQ